MKTTLAAVLIVTLLAGCVSGPPQNQPFLDIQSLSRLTGTYSNAGDPGGYLTALLWPSEREYFLLGENRIPHKMVNSIRVNASDKTVLVEAIANGCIVGSRTFTRGREFEFSDGRILLRRETAILQPGGGIGPSYDRLELGLDSKGDGKLRSTGAFAGLLIALIPIAAYERSDVRFVREAATSAIQSCDR